ncbi:MAG: Rpn family recombination-promoting nuclease/putative transposase [Oscillospiraceae bacterium]|nr:Rpn family recombination-promoting nuclease/putative transposase [Oscillospiraceae bacterium]
MKANREYKSTLFSKLFSDTDNLRELYNAIADTDYGKDTPVEISTLEDVLFKGIKNDISFTIDNRFVVLLEHQSTVSNNMPLRCLMYIARIYEKITNDDAIYGRTLLKIPTPEIIVLYNGAEPFPSEQTLKLSDAYLALDESQSKFGSLELTVRVVNINPGFNDVLFQKSKTLSGYTALIEHLMGLNPTKKTLSNAIKETTKWGLSQNILSTFLTEHGSEVFNMLMAEYSLERDLEVRDEEHRAAMAELTAEKDAEIAELVELTADKDAKIAEQAALIEQLKSEAKG